MVAKVKRVYTEHDKEVARWYNKLHKEERQIKRKNYNKNNPDKTRDQTLRYKYGITLEDFNNLSKQQQNKCSICGNAPDKTAKQAHRRILHVDHCHETGKVRGLLCHSCNLGIGYLKDNISIIDRAKEYLIKMSNRNVV